ncbi:MAG: hypothetical protein ACOYOL_01215 [Chthoniobacterales bacterium]
MIQPSSIVADGPERLHRNAVQRLRADLLARHATELQSGPWHRHLLLRLRIAAEVRREARKIAPSPGSLHQRQP